MKNTKYITLGLSIALTLGVMTICQACALKEDGTWMHCHDAQMMVFYLGIALIIAALLNIFIQNKTVALITGALGIVLSVAAFLIPGIINPMCMMDTMRCHAIMKPFVRIITAVNTVVWTLNLYFNLKTQ